MSHTQVRADEATTNHEENNYGLFSLSADAGTASGSSLLFYATVGIAILGIYLQYKSWKALGAAAYQLGNTSSRTITEVKQR